MKTLAAIFVVVSAWPAVAQPLGPADGKHIQRPDTIYNKVIRPADTPEQRAAHEELFRRQLQIQPPTEAQMKANFARQMHMPMDHQH